MSEREIKFRAWSKREKCWYSGFCLHKSGLFAVLWVPEEPQARWYTDKDMENEGVVIMEFTGLKDKNGKEIYESDVVRWDYKGMDYIRIVTWDADQAMFLPNDMKNDVEVIGNIYENPELVE